MILISIKSWLVHILQENPLAEHIVHLVLWIVEKSDWIVVLAGRWL